MVAVAVRVAHSVVTVFVEVPGAAVGVSLHESVVARGAPLVLLRKDTVALVVDTHRVHLLVDLSSLTGKVCPAVAPRIASFHELNDVGIIGIMFTLRDHHVTPVPRSSESIDAPATCC